MSDSPQEFWNDRYKTDEFIFGREPNAFVKSQAHLFKPGMKVLSIADGEGRNGVFVARQGADVLAVDFSDAALEKAQGLADEFGADITFQQQDVYQWFGEEEAYDIVLAIFIQFAPPEKRTILFNNIKKMVKPGGLIVMEGYRPEQLEYKTGGPPQAENMYTRSLLEEAFSDFDIIHLEEHDSIVDEGKGHSGKSALIDLIARRREDTD